MTDLDRVALKDLKRWIQSQLGPMILESKEQHRSLISGLVEKYQIQQQTLLAGLEIAIQSDCDHSNMKEILREAMKNPVWNGDHITCMQCDFVLHKSKLK